MMAPHLTQERQERLPGENNTQAEIEQMDRSKPEHGVGGKGRRISRQEEQQAPRKEKRMARSKMAPLQAWREQECRTHERDKEEAVP